MQTLARIAILAVLAASSAGCLNVNPANNSYSCKVTSDCPSGYQCIAATKTCWRDGQSPSIDMAMSMPLPDMNGGGGTGGTGGGGGTGGTGGTGGGGPPPTVVPDMTHSTLTITPSAAMLIANGKDAAAVSVILHDANDTAVFGINVVLDTGSTKDSFTPPSGSSDSTGSFASSMTSVVGGSKTVTAHVSWTGGGFDLTGTVSFTPLPAATNSSLTLSTAKVAADGTSTTNISVLILDGNKAPVANATVKLSVVEISGASSAMNTLTQNQTTTSAAGSVTGTLASSLGTNKRVYADVAFANDPANTFSLSADVTFDPIPASSGTTLVITGSNVPADGMTQAPLKVVVHDANGTPVPNAKVTLTVNDGQVTINQPTGTTDSVNGAFSTYATSVSSGIKTFNATVSWSIDGNASNFQTAGSTLTFAALPSGANSSISFAPASALANGSDAVTVTVTVRDFSSSPISGVYVTLSTTDGATGISPANGTTNSSGVITAKVRATTPGSKPISVALSQTQSVTGNATFNALTVSNLVFSTQPTASAGGSVSTVAVQAYDASNVLITTTQVNVALTLQAADGLAMTGVTLNGTKTLNTTAATGTATFNGLSITAASLPRTFTLAASGTLNSTTANQTSNNFTVAANALAAPTLTLTTNGSELDLSWTSVGDSNTSYVVQRKGPNDAGFVTASTLVSTGATSAKDVALLRGTYTYHVVASHAGEQGSQSNDVSGSPATEICITDWNSSTKVGSIFVYAFNANGTTQLMRTISGVQTDLNYPYGIAYRSDTDELYVVNYLPSTGQTYSSNMNVYKRTADNSSTTAITPVRTLTLNAIGTTSDVPGAEAIALDPISKNMVIVYNEPPYAVVSFPITAQNAAGVPPSPSWYLQAGTNVNVKRPQGVTVENVSATDYHVWVAMGAGQANTIYGFDAAAVGTAHDVSSIVYSSSTLATPTGLVIDSVNHALLAANRGNSTIDGFSDVLTANAAGTAPSVLSGTGVASPLSLTFEATGTAVNHVYVLNAGKSITQYDSQAAGTNVSPLATLSAGTLPASDSINSIAVCN